MYPVSGLIIFPYLFIFFLFFFYTESDVTSSNLLRETYPMMDELQSHFQFWGKGSRIFFFFFLRRTIGPEMLSLDHSQRLRLLASGTQRKTHLFSQALLWGEMGRNLCEISRDWWGLLRHVYSLGLQRIIHDY